jgi:hypothetical protein
MLARSSLAARGTADPVIEFSKCQLEREKFQFCCQRGSNVNVELSACSTETRVREDAIQSRLARVTKAVSSARADCKAPST